MYEGNEHTTKEEVKVGRWRQASSESFKGGQGVDCQLNVSVFGLAVSGFEYAVLLKHISSDDPQRTNILGDD